MIKRIVACLLFFCLIIAIPLAIAGVERVELGGAFMALLRNTSKELNTYKIEIPNIPSIPRLNSATGFMVVIDLLISFINGLVNLLNFVVMILNYVIQVLEFFCLLIKNLFTFRDNLQESGDSFPYLPNLDYLLR